MDDIKKTLDALPKIVPLIYILGFIIINGYLSNFGFSDFNILNATYLKVGVLFSFIFCFIFLAIYYAHDKDNLTDDLSKSWPHFILSLENVLFINLIMSFAFIGKLQAPNVKDIFSLIIWILIFIYLGYRLFVSNRYVPKNNKGFLIINIPELALLIIITILNFYKNPNSLTLLVFVIILFFQIVISLGAYGDKKYRGRILSDIFILVFVSFFFGNYLYQNIPSKFGGGQTYSIIVNKDFQNEKGVITKQKDTFSVLYENNERLLLKNKKGKILFTLKSEIKSYEIKK